MIRQLEAHKVNPASEKITIAVVDEPGHGGANHDYRMASEEGGVTTILRFQNGPIQESGVNGITEECLLAIVIDRLECFQSGPFACAHNGMALNYIREGLYYLGDRTRDRQSWGVEGKNEK